MLKVMLDGCLGRDAEVRETPKGGRFVRFTMAANWPKYVDGKNEERTTWFDVISFDPRYTGKVVDSWKKGRALTIIGDLEPELVEKNGKTYLNMTVRADAINFPTRFGSANGDNSKKKEESGEELPKDQPVTMETVQTNNNMANEQGVDDDLPF